MFNFPSLHHLDVSLRCITYFFFAQQHWHQQTQQLENERETERQNITNAELRAVGFSICLVSGKQRKYYKKPTQNKTKTEQNIYDWETRYLVWHFVMWITVLYLQFVAASGSLIHQIYRDTYCSSFIHWKSAVKSINLHGITQKLGSEVLWPQQTVDKTPLTMKQQKWRLLWEYFCYCALWIFFSHWSRYCKIISHPTLFQSVIFSYPMRNVKEDSYTFKGFVNSLGKIKSLRIPLIDFFS